MTERGKQLVHRKTIINLLVLKKVSDVSLYFNYRRPLLRSNLISFFFFPIFTCPSCEGKPKKSSSASGPTTKMGGGGGW